jgi:hypothetical protein
VTEAILCLGRFLLFYFLLIRVFTSVFVSFVCLSPLNTCMSMSSHHMYAYRFASHSHIAAFANQAASRVLCIVLAESQD